MAGQLKFEILTIGNELLIGKILNTNAHWLSRRITSLGGRVTRIITIGDDVDEISMTIRDCLARKPDFIITVGGLGPTFDDKTLEGVARALSLNLKVDSEAFNMVKMKYESLGRARGEKIELTPARIKMATLPEKAKPLTNPVGTAPGVLLEADGVTIISLPGVPDEMKAIFEDSICSIIRGRSKLVFCEKSLRLEGIYESDLAPIIDQVLKINPRVYIKSHPKREEGCAYIELHLSTSDESLEECFRMIDITAAEVKKHVVERGGRVTEIPAGEQY